MKSVRANLVVYKSRAELHLYLAGWFCSLPSCDNELAAKMCFIDAAVYNSDWNVFRTPCQSVMQRSSSTQNELISNCKSIVRNAANSLYTYRWACARITRRTRVWTVRGSHRCHLITEWSLQSRMLFEDLTTRKDWFSGHRIRIHSVRSPFLFDQRHLWRTAVH